MRSSVGFSVALGEVMGREQVLKDYIKMLVANMKLMVKAYDDCDGRLAEECIELFKAAIERHEMDESLNGR